MIVAPQFRLLLVVAARHDADVRLSGLSGACEVRLDEVRRRVGIADHSMGAARNCGDEFGAVRSCQVAPQRRRKLP